MRGARRKTSISIILCIVLWMMNIMNVFAQSSTTYTYTMSVYEQWVKTQDAYLPGKAFFIDDELMNPSDIFIKDNKMYVADTGNSRIVILDMKTQEIQVVGEDILTSPTGIFVEDNGEMIVADLDAKAIYILSPKGSLIKEIGRPDTVMFGEDTPWEPEKVVADKAGNIYVVGRGSIGGLIQMTKEDEFLGYFGDNKSQMTVLGAFQELIFTDEQKRKLFNRIPPCFSNAAVDNRGLVYTITPQQKGQVIKKHNVSGTNILFNSAEGKMADEKNFTDLYIGKWGQIYALTSTGLIYEYDTEGKILFSFGGVSSSSERNGTFALGSSIAVDENDCLYVADSERGIVQSFYPTEFANRIHNAMTLFNQGKYHESQTAWEEILKLSGVSEMAHNGMGKSYFNQQDFEQAAEHFKLANNKEEYSEAFWEIRNKWLEDNMGYVLPVIIILLALLLGYSFYTKKKRALKPEYSSYKCPEGSGILADIRYMWNMCRHPIDASYYIKTNQRISVNSAFVVMGLSLALFLIYFVYSGFIFNLKKPYTNYFLVILLFIVPVFLWTICSYMIATINDGEGKLPTVFKTTVYALSPYIILAPISIILSNVLTINEEFILDLIKNVSVVGGVAILVITIKEIHDYSIKDTIKNILITLFLIFVILVVAALMYSLWDSIIEFIFAVFKEVFYRVTGL